MPVQLDFQSLAAGYGGHLFNKIARDIIGADIAVFETSNLNPNVMLEMGVALTWGDGSYLSSCKVANRHHRIFPVRLGPIIGRALAPSLILTMGQNS